jgi:RHH-type proline utilization regulon transcriptional repressor/proline dehydrogenase/delta 1-pyrroline-5-carboxylate dehydrogenase
VQNEIADRLLAQLRAAMQELQIGDPGDLATDIGPLIDDEAKAGVAAHIEAMRAAGKSVFQLPLPESCRGGSFVAPTLIEIDSLSELQREVFGPVVHMLRFATDELDPLIDAINATGYGLTFGLHSRIDETIAHVTSRIRAGNRYVNRNMVGAVVGVQPFGGEGLSGTGPKAGGPLYLHRLLGSADLTPLHLPAATGNGTADVSHEFRTLSDWASREGKAELVSACAFYTAHTLLHREMTLPGPTGERNTLHFAPRGSVLCLAPTADTLFEQIAAALATGNDVLIEATAAHLLKKTPAELNSQIRRLEQSNEVTVSAILFAGDQQDRRTRAMHTAAQEGPLIPIISPDAISGRYPLYRLLTERVTSINTTAAGGNTTLMTLSP